MESTEPTQDKSGVHKIRSWISVLSFQLIKKIFGLTKSLFKFVNSNFKNETVKCRDLSYGISWRNSEKKRESASRFYLSALLTEICTLGIPSLIRMGCTVQCWGACGQFWEKNAQVFLGKVSQTEKTLAVRWSYFRKSSQPNGTAYDKILTFQGPNWPLSRRVVGVLFGQPGELD